MTALLKSVDESKLEIYLTSRNWEKLGENEEYGISFWSSPLGKHRILVPKNRNLTDYQDRLQEAIQIVCSAENKSFLDLLRVIEDLNQTATTLNQEVFNLRILANQNPDQTQIAAKDLGSILGSLQDCIEAIACAENGNPLQKRGKVPESVRSQTQIVILETFKGSFGVKMALGSNVQQRSIFDDLNLAQKTLQEFLKLLRISKEKDFESLKEVILKLQHRTSVLYQKLLWDFIKSDSDLVFDWGSTNQKIGGQVYFKKYDMHITLGELQKIDNQQVETLSLRGELLLAGDRKHAKFIFRDLDQDDMYSGQISPTLYNRQEQGEVELTINKIYLAEIEERVSVSSLSGEERLHHTLTNLHVI